MILSYYPYKSNDCFIRCFVSVISDLQVNVYHRGCFSVERTLEPKCYQVLSVVNEHLEFLNVFKDILTGSTLGDFNGEFCIDGPRGKGNKPSSVFSVVVIVLFFALYI